MKRTIISCSILLTVALANGQTILSDNFESYTVGTWPAPWIQDGNASDTANNRIETDPAGAGSKTLRLFGMVGGCWAAIAYLPFTNTDFFEVEFDVYNGNESLSGCHEGRAYVGLRQGVSWLNFSHAMVQFLGDGTIWGQGQLLQSYQNLRWYHVKITYARIGSAVNQSYWIDGTFRGSVTTTVNPSQQTSLDHFEFSSQEGSAWFDNLVVRYAPRIADDFESYGTNTWPAAWIPDANAYDTAHNRIETNPAGGGSKTLRLFGELGGCWGAIAYLPFTHSDSFEFECDVYNGNETLSGCHPSHASINLRQGTSWVNPFFALVRFSGDGKIWGQNQALQTFQTLQWYHVKIVYLRNGTTLRQGYWIDGVYRGTETNTISPSLHTSLDHFELNVEEGSAWFDNLVIRVPSQSSIRVSQVEICWSSLSNQTYLVQYRSDLTTNNWVDLGSPIPSDGGTKCATDAIVPGQAQRFYRVVLAP